MNQNRKKLSFSIIQENKRGLFLDFVTFKEWGLNEGDTFLLQAGQLSLKTPVYSDSTVQQQCQITHSMQQMLCLPPVTETTKITLTKTENMITLGPCLSILINQELNQDQTFGEMDKFYQEMALYCQEKGYIFSIISIQPIMTNEAVGYMLHDGEWLKQKVPLPNVLYNRVHSRRSENSSHYQQLFEEITKRNILMFNSHFLSKLDVHEALLKNGSLLPHLPESIQLQNEESFCSFLKQFSSIYIKPIHGSQGRNIIKVHQINEQWVIEFSESNLPAKIAATEDEVFSFVKKYSKRRSYLLQKALTLANWEQKTVDFRILLHLKPNGRWQITSSIARMGEANRIVNNVARGATMQNSKHLLMSSFPPSEAKKIHHSLLQLAIEVAETIEKEVKGFYGELGIDLGLDEQLHPWIIEVNSKPSKKFEGNYTKQRPSVKALINLMEAKCLGLLISKKE